MFNNLLLCGVFVDLEIVSDSCLNAVFCLWIFYIICRLGNIQWFFLMNTCSSILYCGYLQTWKLLVLSLYHLETVSNLPWYKTFLNRKLYKSRGLSCLTAMIKFIYVIFFKYFKGHHVKLPSFSFRRTNPSRLSSYRRGMLLVTFIKFTFSSADPLSFTPCIIYTDWIHPMPIVASSNRSNKYTLSPS